MKQSIKKISLLIALTAGLTACGGGGGNGGGSNGGGSNGGGGNGGGSTVSKYNGTWKSAKCKRISTSNTSKPRSFKQTWTLNGTSLKNNVKVWRTNASCQYGAILPVEVEANIEYKDEVAVIANTCAGGKAQQVDISYKSLKAGDTALTDEKNIQGVLKSQGISNSLPKYGLICIGNDGKLYKGLITADKDASTAAKRPTEMDTSNPLIP